MRVGLVVERRYFAVSIAAVEGLRFGQGLVGLEPEQRQPAFPREVFEAQEDPGPEAETTSVGRDPHPLDLAIGRMTLQGAAPDGLFVQGGQHEVALRRRELRRGGRYAARRIVAGFEPDRELREVAFEAVPGGRTVGILHRQAPGAACKASQPRVLFGCSDNRRLPATRVNVGFAAPPVAYTDAPATYRLPNP